jgi:hypothetical protein
MMHRYLNLNGFTPVEMQPIRFAVAMGARFAAAMDELEHSEASQGSGPC